MNGKGYRYIRLDGSTKIEQRQHLMDKFNNDKRIFIFILSTRSGGVGMNLTGADAVIFYDSDWNPQIDGNNNNYCINVQLKRWIERIVLVKQEMYIYTG